MKLIKQIFLLYDEPFINQAYSVKMAGQLSNQVWVQVRFRAS